MNLFHFSFPIHVTDSFIFGHRVNNFIAILAPRQKAQARKGVEGTGGKNTDTDVNEILPWKCRA